MQSRDVNILSSFLGVRDIEFLRKEELIKKYNIEKADVFVLFGGSILEGIQVLHEAIQVDIAKKYLLVGGGGHTTEALRKKIHEMYPDIETSKKMESEILKAVLEKCYGETVDFIEKESTNCGNNIEYLLKLLNEKNISCKSIILSQDLTMQKRMDATLKKYAPEMTVINYASYKVKVVEKDHQMVFSSEPEGMWDMNRFITLLMGEIPRLLDEETGYGPKGKNFISHVDIPDEVLDAFNRIKNENESYVREGNPKYASK